MDELANLPLDLNFDIPSLVAGLIFGIVGWYVFKRGRRDAKNKLVVVGLLLMIYPYFVRGAVWNWGLGIVLSEAAYYFWDDE